MSAGFFVLCWCMVCTFGVKPPGPTFAELLHGLSRKVVFSVESKRDADLRKGTGCGSCQTIHLPANAKPAIKERSETANVSNNFQGWLPCRWVTVPTACPAEAVHGRYATELATQASQQIQTKAEEAERIADSAWDACTASRARAEACKSSLDIQNRS